MDYLESHRRMVDGFNRGDLSPLAERLDENVVAHLVDSWPEQRLVGAASYLKWLQELLDSVGGDVRLKDLRQTGEIVATRFSVQMHGQASALEDEREYGQLDVYHRGKIVLILYFDDFADALATTGV